MTASDGVFNPNSLVTFEQGYVMLARLYDLAIEAMSVPRPLTPRFTDYRYRPVTSIRMLHPGNLAIGAMSQSQRDNLTVTIENPDVLRFGSRFPPHHSEPWFSGTGYRIEFWPLAPGEVTITVSCGVYEVSITITVE